MKHDYLLLGEVVRPQGIHGEVKLRHYTDDPERFLELKTVYREREGRYEPIGVTGARVREDDVFLMLEGVRDRNAAEALRGVKLWVDRAHARELGEDEVYIADILGAEAYDTQGNRVGTLREVLTPGGVDVFVFDTPTGTLMAPALKTVLLELDAENGKIVLQEILHLLKRTNKFIVCEGVETKEMVDFLVVEGCDELQGYYYYKPMEMAKFEQLIG